MQFYYSKGLYISTTIKNIQLYCCYRFIHYHAELNNSNTVQNYIVLLQYKIMQFCSSIELFSSGDVIKLFISIIVIELYTSTIIQKYTDLFEYRFMQFYCSKEFTVLIQYRIILFYYRYRIIHYRSVLYCSTTVHNSAVLEQ